MRRYENYKDYVGPPARYPLVGLAYRDLLDDVGLRSQHLVKFDPSRP